MVLSLYHVGTDWCESLRLQLMIFFTASAAIGSELKQLQNASWVATGYMLSSTNDLIPSQQYPSKIFHAVTSFQSVLAFRYEILIHWNISIGLYMVNLATFSVVRPVYCSPILFLPPDAFYVDSLEIWVNLSRLEPLLELEAQGWQRMLEWIWLVYI